MIIATDNAALAEVFNPDSDYITRKERPGKDRLLRWASFLKTSCTYDIVHIPGETNVVSDFISRMRFPPDKVELFDEDDDGTGPVSFANFTTNFLSAALDPDWNAPTISDIHLIAGRDGRNDLTFLTEAESLGANFDPISMLWMKDGRILIPIEIRPNLIASCHNGLGGHRGVSSTYDQLEQFVYWPGMRRDIQEAIASCLICSTHDSRMPKRPYGITLQPRLRGEIICADFLHITPDGNGDFSKILIISDKLSKYSMFYPCESESSASTAHAIMQWIALFGPMDVFVSDKGSAWTAQVISDISSSIGFKLHTTTARAHWANGSQERINGLIRSITKKVLTENNMNPKEWTDILPLIQTIFNHSPSNTLGGLAPITVFTGLSPMRPIDFFLRRTAKEKVILESNTISGLQNFVEELQRTMDSRVNTVTEIQESLLLDRNEKRLNEPNVHPLQVEPGDYVMVYNHNKVFPKLSADWIGPAKVIEILANKNVKIQFIHEPNRTSQIHENFVKPFAKNTLEITPELIRQAEYNATCKYNVEEISDIRLDHANNVYELKVKWEDGTTTWENARQLHEDIPRIVETYLSNAPKSKNLLVNQAKGFIGL